ncbi:T9SS type A sorting domain-containing protein [Ferruginibacter sp.]
MKKYIITALCFIALQANAQTIQRSVIGSAGTVQSNASYKLCSTVGEAITKKLSVPGLTINQGFQQNKIAGTALPVLGLDFTATRLNKNEVKLTWKTIQEINNKGFHIERRKENESNYAAIGFVASNTIDGNSSFPLSYTTTDTNNFSGNTYYRLKQEDKDGRNTYSVISVVKGDVNKQLTMQVWPVPSTGPISVVVNGLGKPDMLQVFDVSGRLLKQQAIQNNLQAQLTNLAPGTYILRLAENKDVVQKIIIQ